MSVFSGNPTPQEATGPRWQSTPILHNVLGASLFVLLDTGALTYLKVSAILPARWMISLNTMGAMAMLIVLAQFALTTARLLHVTQLEGITDRERLREWEALQHRKRMLQEELSLESLEWQGQQSRSQRHSHSLSVSGTSVPQTSVPETPNSSSAPDSPTQP